MKHILFVSTGKNDEFMLHVDSDWLYIWSPWDGELSEGEMMQQQRYFVILSISSRKEKKMCGSKLDRERKQVGC